MEPYFKEDTYRTPDKVKGYFFDRLLFKRRLYFYWKYITHIVIPARNKAVKGVYDTPAWAKSSYDTLKMIERFDGKFTLEGLDKLAGYKPPVVFVSNHMSTIETHILPCLITPYMEVTFIVKAQLLRVPLFGSILGAREPIVVGRTNPRQDLQLVIEDGSKNLENGRSIIVFPQSSRNAQFIQEDFNTLGIKLAKKTGAQVVPVALKTDYWENGRFIRDFGPIRRKKHIYFAFGDPITVSGRGKEEHEEVKKFIKDKLDEWKN